MDLTDEKAASTDGARAGADVEVGVRLPLPLDDLYDYRVPAGLDVAVGDFVVVPFGPRHLVGVVWGGAAGDVAPEKLKVVLAVLDLPPLPAAFRDFVDWVANYNLAAKGTLLRMVMSVPDALEPPKPRPMVVPGDRPPVRMTAARARVLSAAADDKPRSVTDLARAAGVGQAVVRGLVSTGALRLIDVAQRPDWAHPDPARPGPRLSAAQAAAAGDLRERVEAGGFGVTLLDGVTGSGKTEVYFEAVAAALRAGRQVLVMLPEIALSAQWLDRFKERFGAAPAPWHSDLTQKQRREIWRGIARGEVRVVVGARSALFLPLNELGLVVVDEEHDPAYKQEEGVIYNARDMAVVRGRLAGIPVVLVSATPSLETFTNVRMGRYRHLRLPDRFAGATLPEMQLIDIRRDRPPRNAWLSPPLKAAVTSTLADGEQVMLFLNRRGYAPLTLCRACGHRMRCPNCSTWLVEHRFAGRLACHHCGHARPLPKECPNCEAAETFAACGPGVERLAEEVAAVFPDARLAVMTSDSVAGPEAAAAMIRKMEAHEIDLLIGTQMVTKGYHFPKLTLVGVVDADLGLAGGDLRAAERTYQLLTQVAGRAGRARHPGRVLLQTTDPNHPVMQALIEGDRDKFLAIETEARREAAMPPFARLAAVIVSGTDEERARVVAAELGRRAPSIAGVEVLGPAPAPLHMLRGRYRHRLLVKARRDIALQPVVRRWLAEISWPPSVRVQVDIDPYSFL